jgi:hypothetical protein
VRRGGEGKGREEMGRKRLMKEEEEEEERIGEDG